MDAERSRARMLQDTASSRHVLPEKINNYLKIFIVDVINNEPNLLLRFPGKTRFPGSSVPLELNIT